MPRKDAWDKVTGSARYADDTPAVGILEARLLASTCAHAKILEVDTTEALGVKGVKAILTGEDCAVLFGPLLQDRPALARDVVRYVGEPVALVVAQEAWIAEQAVRLIRVNYEQLPIVLKPVQALAPGAPCIHQKADGYKKTIADIYPEAGSNVASRYCIRKGNAQKMLESCETIAEQHFFLPPSGHLAMEVRTARAEISGAGDVKIVTASQAPYTVRQQLAEAFLIPSGKIQVQVPFVGGGFGGKAPVMLEILAFLASRCVGGRPVRLELSREQDMATAPCRMGLEARLKMGTDREGRLQAAELQYWLDCGAYTDISPYMAKAIAVDCTGPYHVENLSCDALCVYTNHTYVTSFRGFSHESMTFCIERVMDILAQKLRMDPLEFRRKNAIRPGDCTPSQVKCTASLIGNLGHCLEAVGKLAAWEEGVVRPVGKNVVRAKGVACLWKTENPPTDAVSGALITCNSDGSVNLHTGVVEMGSNGQTHIAQMLAERLKMDAEQVHVVTDVDTRTAPEHWKTVASLTGYMAGHATMQAADDILAQLRRNGALALECPTDEIEVANGKVFARKNPEQFIALKDIVKGYKTACGDSIGEPVIGRGGFMLKGLSMLDPATGKGKTGPTWTVGAQIVEVEANLKTYSYRIINAATVMDVGKVTNFESMRAAIAGGMAMGLSLASREQFSYGQKGIPLSPNLRTYKLLHIGQEPDYRVGFIETPDENAPYGVRSYSEHGIIGMAGALGNALSAAFGKQLSVLPLKPETIWRAVEEKYDTI